MAYIGRGTDNISNVEVLDNITFSGASSYTLKKGGANFVPVSANNILLSIDGVVQANNFSVSGSTINFGTAVTGTCNFVLHFGTGLITTVQDGAVTTVKIGNDAVTYAKLQNLATANRVLGSTSTGLIGETQIATAMVSDDAITYAKMQDTSAANRVLGAASAGTVGEVQVATDMIADAQVDESKLKISNAPTNGYFLSAQSGNTGGMTWAEAGGGYTQSSVLTPSGASVEFTNIPSGTNSIVFKSYGLQWAGSPGNIQLQIGDSGGYETSGYQSVDFYRGVSAGDMGANTSTSSYILAYGYSGSDYWNGNLFLNHVGGNRWVMGYLANDVSQYLRIGSGQKILSGELTKLKIFNAGGTNADGGNVQIMYQ
tara:strand:- start:1082 stop:2194 length:1113 start_codon:yes stop_codon:yes gene_type:complete